MTIKVGDRMPSGTLHTMTKDGPSPVATDELFAGKKVVLFSVPGAFTPTMFSQAPSGICHPRHRTAGRGHRHHRLHGSQRRLRHGGARGRDPECRGRCPDAGRRPARTTAGPWGLELDLSAMAFGVRGKRFSLLVDDGIVARINIDEEGFSSTSAETMLQQLA